MATPTPNLNLNRPNVGSDDDVWGSDPGGWNENARLIDDLFHPSTGHNHDGTGTNGSPIVPPGLAGMATDGLVVRTSAATHTPRSVIAGDGIRVENGNGVAGDPQIFVDYSGVGQIPEAAANDEMLIADVSESNDTKFATVLQVLRIADTAETSAGVITDKTVSPRGLSQSVFGTTDWPLYVIDGAAEVIVQNGLFYIPWADKLTGQQIFNVIVDVVESGNTGSLLTVDVVNTRTTNSIFTTPVTVDANETSSRTAATPAVINPAEAAPQVGDLLRIDVTAVSDNAQKGLIVTFRSRIP